MSKLVEELHMEYMGAKSAPRIVSSICLKVDELGELLAHIERLNEEVASWQRVHRAEYEKREALDAHIERLEAEKTHLIVSMGHLEERTRQAEHEARVLFNDDAMPASAVGVMTQQTVQEGFVVVPAVAWIKTKEAHETLVQDGFYGAYALGEDLWQEWHEAMIKAQQADKG